MAMDKTFDAAAAEARLSAAWEAAGCFRAGANAKAGADTFCIMLPPPTSPDRYMSATRSTTR